MATDRSVVTTLSVSIGSLVMHQHPDLYIQHACNGGEVGFNCADGSRYMVDGNDSTTHTVYEYLGSFWHGCSPVSALFSIVPAQSLTSPATSPPSPLLRACTKT